MYNKAFRNLFCNLFVIHKRVFTTLQDILTCTIKAVNHTWNSTIAFISLNAIVDFEEWLTVSFYSSRKILDRPEKFFGDNQELQHKLRKALLYIEATYDIFNLTHCVYITRWFFINYLTYALLLRISNNPFKTLSQWHTKKVRNKKKMFIRF